MKRMIAAAALTAFVMQGLSLCGTQQMINISAESDEITVQLNTDYHQLRLKWDPMNDPACLSYRVTVQSVADDGTAADLYVISTQDCYLSGLEPAAYACQENGFCPQMRFRIEALAEDDSVLAEGFSPVFSPAEYFPEKEKLVIGTDIREEDITGFTWNGNGSTAEACFRFDLERTEDRITFSGSWNTEAGSHQEKEITFYEKEWNTLLDFIRTGSVVREHVKDPEIIILDGSVNEMKLSWNGMTEPEESFYLFLPSDREAMETWIYSLGNKGNPVKYGGFIALISAAIAAILYKIKSRRR